MSKVQAKRQWAPAINWTGLNWCMLFWIAPLLPQKCPVWSWTAWGILPHEILKWIEGSVVPQTFILWDRRVLECKMLQSLKLSNISAHDFLDGWPLGHRVLDYAWLAFQSIELMFTYREHLTSVHTKCEVNSLRLYRCLQMRNQIQKRKGPYV